MTKTCVICKKQPIPGDFTRSFHKFPKNTELQQKWMQIIGIKGISKVSTVCSDHFGDVSYHQTDGYTKMRRLLSTAVPLYGKTSVLKQTTDNIGISSPIEEITCSVDINEYSSSESLDEHDGSQDLVNGIGCDTDLSSPQPINTNTTKSDKMNTKRKQSITNESTLPKKKFYFMNGCQPSYVSREDFISDEAWGRFIKLIRYKNRQIAAANKKIRRRGQQKHI